MPERGFNKAWQKEGDTQYNLEDLKTEDLNTKHAGWRILGAEVHPAFKKS